MTIRYDAYGAPITSTVHEPMVEHYPRTLEQPAELTVTCTCGWDWFSQEGAGGGLESWGDAFEAHTDEAVRLENGDPES